MLTLNNKKISETFQYETITCIYFDIMRINIRAYKIVKWKNCSKFFRLVLKGKDGKFERFL